jgi:hypothetical protein
MSELMSGTNGMKLAGLLTSPVKRFALSKPPTSALLHASEEVWQRFIREEKKTFTVSIEGNIGAGKSTFLNQFRDDSSVAIFEVSCSKHGFTAQF